MSEKQVKITAEVLRVYDQNNNVTANELANIIGVDRDTIKRCVARINHEVPNRIILKSGKLLTVHQLIPSITKIINKGDSYSASSIARDLGVDRGTVAKALRIISNEESVKA
jgi:DNA-binding MarR family transcriptional regulator